MSAMLTDMIVRLPQKCLLGLRNSILLSFDWQLQARPLYMCAIYVVITDVSCKRSCIQPFCNREEINKM